MNRLITLMLILALAGAALCALRDLPYKEKYETPEFSINFLPVYPLVIGQTSRINIKTSLNATELSLFLPDQKRLILKKENGVWAGTINVTDAYKEGWQPLYVYIQHQVAEEDRPLADRLLDLFRPGAVRYRTDIVTKRIWIRAFKPLPIISPGAVMAVPEAPRPIPTYEVEALRIYPSAEVLPAPEAAGAPLLIRGTRLFGFTSKSLEGSKEGYVPGLNREESLRISVVGKVADTDVDANFFSTSTIGTTTVASQEENISILLRRASTEAYFGDFTADLTDLEFAKLNRRLSGIKLSGKYDKWGFKALASTPQGQSKFIKVYGDGTQGPYYLPSTPVVIDSERVYVDGIAQKRGTNYDIDYNAGTVTFKNKTIIKTSIIEVYYDYRTTIYQHNTYAGRLMLSPSPNLKLGATWIDDSDSMRDAQNIFNNQASGTIEPQSHYVVGVDGSMGFSDLLMAQGEVAYSEQKTNLITDPQAALTGKAAKLETVSLLGPWGLKTSFKKIGTNFLPVGDADPKQNLWAYSGLLTYRPNELFLGSGNFGSEAFTQAGTAFKNIVKSAKLRLTPEKWPSLEYLLDEYEESNDPVPPYSSFNRLTVKNSLETIKNLGALTFSAKGAEERRIVRSPSEEVTTYKIANLGLSLMGGEMFSTSLNAELKETTLPTTLSYLTKTYNLNLSATPRREYLASLALNYVDNAEDGVTNVMDLALKAEPSDKIRADGKYTITSVKETFNTSEEGVIKYVGSIRLELRPFQPLRLRYYYKPNYTLVNSTQGISYNNELQQYEMNLALGGSAMAGATLQRGNNFTADKTDYPTYKRLYSKGDSTSQLYSIKAAPLRFLSLEFNVNLQDSSSYTLNTPVTLETYARSNSAIREFNAMVKTSLSERFAIDSSYSNKLSTTGSNDAWGDTINSLAQTGSLKGIWNVNDNFTLSASYAYTQSLNLLAPANQETYTLTPGGGFILRYSDYLRLDGDASFSRSYAGTVGEMTDYSLRAKYDISEFLHVTLRVDREISSNPDYRTTDFYSNIEINL